MGALNRENDPFTPGTDANKAWAEVAGRAMHALIPPPLVWFGYTKGYPWRESGYTRWRHAASLHLGPFCLQWRMPYRA